MISNISWLPHFAGDPLRKNRKEDKKAWIVWPRPRPNKNMSHPVFSRSYGPLHHLFLLAEGCCQPFEVAGALVPRSHRRRAVRPKLRGKQTWAQTHPPSQASSTFLGSPSTFYTRDALRSKIRETVIVMQYPKDFQTHYIHSFMIALLASVRTFVFKCQTPDPYGMWGIWQIASNCLHSHLRDIAFVMLSRADRSGMVI